MTLTPYISKVIIKNFRNFRQVNVDFTHKQVIIGENNVGKTNFLRALQLILDPTLSDEDRNLSESDFHESLNDPMETGEEIKIEIEIRGYEHNKVLLSTLCDASVSSNPPTLRLTYRFYPVKKEDDSIEYRWEIFQGTKHEVPFGSYERKYLNLRVIQAIRDVESDMRNSRKSPVGQLLKRYDIDKEELKKIAENLKKQSDDILSLDEIVDLQRNINRRFSNVAGIQGDKEITLGTSEVEANRILNTLKLLMGERSVSETSLGLNNILFISLILLHLDDRTVPSFLKKDRYDELSTFDKDGILSRTYTVTERNNYVLSGEATEEDSTKLVTFMQEHNASKEGVTFLAIEEPEAHLHPSLQRIIYRDVMKSSSSLLLTTHSTHITSVAPLNSIVHLRTSKNGTKVSSTAALKLDDRDRLDLERYLDVKRGEIYFGKGVILVEGIAEEYLVPRFAELIEKPLDEKGIIVCNVNSTNFMPFIKFLDALAIPNVVVTDGDYYYKTVKDAKTVQVFHEMHSSQHKNIGYLGHEIAFETLSSLGKVDIDEIPDDFSEQDSLLSDNGFYVGKYTFEVDIMQECSKDKKALEIIINLFNQLTLGGQIQKRNFKQALESGDYWGCLNKIESNTAAIGKGRFAQTFSNYCIREHIPGYIEEAIKSVYFMVDEVEKVDGENKEMDE